MRPISLLRRRLLAGGALWSLGFPGLARAQRGQARVGWLSLYERGLYAEVTSRGFVRGLREAGYLEGQNLTFVKRSGEGDIRKLRALAREIVEAKVDVLFAPAKPMADAAWYASREVPTVIATVTDPVVVQYAHSLAKPGKHITGVTTANAELIGKRMQLLTELVPGLKRVGTLLDTGLLESCQEEMNLMNKAADRLGLTIVPISVMAEALDIEAAMKRAQAAKVQAIITAPMTTNLDITDRVAALATRYGLPFIHDVPQLASEGLAVYGPDFEDIFRRAGHYVARILKGEKPALMAIEEPKQFRLIVNAGVAKRLGLTVPQAVLLRADEIIE
ncbi:MAG TPA: ABC transporter substrate-binding protein [Burkholderiales bacterium]|jgi:putative ABC transport system substrate-binding protein|nr:ABC transporter substrate-binding protein [Burkholderiales bacterium]